MAKFVVYIITVDANGNATVTPDAPALKVGDQVSFISNDPTTVIRYRDTSPFAEAEVGPQKELPVGKGQGPYKCVTEGKHHFDCGFMNNNKFQLWGVTKGADTPVGH